MRGALILPSQFPNGPKLKAQGIDTVAKEADEIDQAKMDALREFFKVVSMRDPSWTVPNNEFYAWTQAAQIAWAKEFARMFSKDFVNHSSPSFGHSVMQCYGMPDIEYKSAVFMVEFIREFRRLRNLRIIFITLESMQGGWMSPELILLINSDPNIFIVPQAYGSEMDKYDTAVVVIDLIKRGIKWEKLLVFHSLRGGLPPSGWQGFVYLENWEQLP